MSFDHLRHAIYEQWPSYLGYATSFLTIGGLWLIHHAIFRRMEFADSVVVRLNLMLLMTVSFLPFPTRLMAEALHLTSLARYASREQLIHDTATRCEVRALSNRVGPSLGF